MRERITGNHQYLEERRFSLFAHDELIPSDLRLKCQYKLDTNQQMKTWARENTPGFLDG